MKTISARQFRLTFQELTEPVSVTRRTDEGYVTVGTWTPAKTTAYIEGDFGRAVLKGMGLDADETRLATDTTPITARSFRPVPKPRKRA